MSARAVHVRCVKCVPTVLIPAQDGSTREELPALSVSNVSGRSTGQQLPGTATPDVYGDAPVEPVEHSVSRGSKSCARDGVAESARENGPKYLGEDTRER